MELVLEHDLRCENLGFSVMIFLVCKALKRVKFCNLTTYSNTPHAYQRCTNSGGRSTGSPLVRTPRQGSWIAGSIPVQLIFNYQEKI